nr:hypothetical protein [Tanacetum cinerariifolium]
ASVLIKKSHDAVKLQALIDRKKCMSAKRTAWNEFSSSMASAFICLSTVMINAQVDNLSSHNTKYTSHALTQKVFTNMRRIVKEDVDDNEVPAAPSPPTLATTSPQKQPTHPGILESSMNLLNKLMETCATLTQKVANLEQDKIAQTLEIVKLKRESQEVGEEEKIQIFWFKEDTDEAEPAKVTAAKLMTYVVTTVAPITTDAQVPKASAPRRRRGVVIQDPEETAAAAVIVHTELEAELNANINWNDVIEQVKRREKNDNTVMRYQALKRKHVTEAQARKNMMIYLKNMADFKMDFFKGMTYSEIRPMFKKHYNSIQAFLKKEEEEVTVQEKRKDEILEQETAKKQRIDEDAEELKRHLQIVANFKANVWRDQKGRYGLAKVKSWKLFESCGVHIITLTTTQMFLLVEKKYPLTHFTLEQMLNNVRLEVEVESEMSLELLSLVRRQLNEGYVPE